MTHEFLGERLTSSMCRAELKFFHRSARSGKWSENSAGKWGANSTNSNKWGANSSGNKFGKSGSNIWNSASGKQYSNTGLVGAS